MIEANRNNFGHDTTTDEVLEGIDLTGKLALVTGATSGLGAETARALASKGAQVVITARNMDRAEKVVSDIKSATGNHKIEIEELELDSLNSIRAFAERFLAKHEALSILVNNAGVMACPPGKTADGFEMQFGTNHLGHFLLTGLIVPALLKGSPARIVVLSSRGHQLSPVVFEDVNFEQRDYNKWVSYGKSKTANVLHVIELENRLGKHGVHAYAVHPGVIQTELSRHMDQADFDMIISRAGGNLKTKTVPAGAATSVYAATAPELEGRGGLYLYDCQIAEVDDDTSVLDCVRSYAIDPVAAAQLWSVSEKMVGQGFDL